MTQQSFEEALARLETIVRELDGGKLPLDEALARFEEGVRLARVCRDRLAGAEERLRELADDGGERAVSLTPK